MTACASLDRIAISAITDDPEPVVLINGAPEPRLAVASHHVAGPLDIRTSQLVSNDVAITSSTRSRWLNAQTTIAIPLQLTDGQTTWAVLSNGQLNQLDTCEAIGTHELRFELHDVWTDLTEKSIADIWWVGASATLYKMYPGMMKVGRSANRSANKVLLNGSLVYVLQEGSDLVWTVAEAIKTLFSICQLRFINNWSTPSAFRMCVVGDGRSTQTDTRCT